jgi:hypothetical protein
MIPLLIHQRGWSGCAFSCAFGYAFGYAFTEAGAVNLITIDPPDAMHPE